MGANYLIEIRLGGEVKQYLRDIIHDVADEFGVQGAVRHRPVPHITLYGPFSTDDYGPVLSAIRTTAESYTKLPFRVEGFNHFDNRVIYADIATSPELRQFRRELANALLDVTYTHAYERDTKHTYYFHTTVAFRDIEDQFSRIWRYVNREYDMTFNEYALRVTFLRGGNMIKEYDVLRDTFLNHQQATSRSSWELTMEQLSEVQSSDDHEHLHRHSSDKPTKRLRRTAYRLSEILP